MGRGSTQALIKKLINCLLDGSKSITEIADKTGLDRTALVKYLDLLKDGGLLIEEQIGSSRVFTLVPQYRTDTYFGLPINSKTEEQINSLYKYIEVEWKKNAGRPLLKTTAQKIIYKVIKKCNLNIPVGWYIYGGVCIKPYEPYTEYKYTDLTEKIISCVSKIVKEYSHNVHEYESKQQQYHEEVRMVYILKEEIFSLVYSKKFSKNSMYIFQKKYVELIQLVPKGDKIYHALINDYYTTLIDITKNWDIFVNENKEEEFSSFKQKLISSFEILWKLIAQFHLKKDLLEGGFYTQTVLDGHFKLDIEQTKDELTELGSELQLLIPSEEPKDENYKKLKKSIGSGRLLNSEEQKEKETELEKIREEKGDEGVSEYLFKKFGLNLD